MRAYRICPVCCEGRTSLFVCKECHTKLVAELGPVDLWKDEPWFKALKAATRREWQQQRNETLLVETINAVGEEAALARRTTKYEKALALLDQGVPQPEVYQQLRGATRGSANHASTVVNRAARTLASRVERPLKRA